jgi:opacity protein-like surface antigen
VAEALQVMASAYRKLGLNDLAKTADNVRQANANKPDLMSPTSAAAGVAVAGTSGAVGAEGETSGSWNMGAPEQAGRWEGSVGLAQSTSSDVDFEGGTTAAIESGLGFNVGVGYHFNNRLRFGSTFNFDQKDYSAEVASDDPNVRLPIKGSMDTMSLMFDVAYTFLTGPVTPYVVGGLGWSWVDTNVATEPPQTGCWWHPWWGYICTSWQDTRTIDGLAYEAGIGLRYDLTDKLAADGAYRMRWADFDQAKSAPSFDTFQLQLIWKF